MKLFTAIVAATQALDMSTLFLMQSMQTGGLNNPLIMMQLLDGKISKDLLPLMLSSGGNMQSMMPLLMMSDLFDKESDETGEIVFKPETDYQAVCEEIADIADKMSCVQNVFKIYTCSQANAVSITDLTDSFNQFNDKLASFNTATDCTRLCVENPTTDSEKQACDEAKEAHKAIFPEESNGESKLKALFDDDMLMMMMMSGQNPFGGVGAAGGATPNPALMLQLLS